MQSLRKALAFPLLMVSALIPLGCDEAGTSHTPLLDHGSSEMTLEMMVFPRKVTSPHIAETNLLSAADAWTQRYESIPTTANAVQAVSHLHSRAQMLGTVEDYMRAHRIASNAWEKNQVFDAMELLASSHIALHRFDAARELLNATTLDRPHNASERIEALHWDIEQSQGTADRTALIHYREAQAASRPNYLYLTRLASAYIYAGEFALADDAFVRALRAYEDVSPIPVAWVQFQRGVMWAEAAGIDAPALALYKDAVKLLPGFLVANVHLSEFEVESTPDTAIARLEVLTGVGDPEPSSKLSQFYAQLDDTNAAAKYRADARKRYLDLTDREPLAFSDHAIEFFLAHGETAKAVELSLLNLDNRPTERAYELAITALAEDGNLNQACAVSDAIDFMPTRAGLNEALSSLREHCRQ